MRLSQYTLQVMRQLRDDLSPLQYLGSQKRTLKVFRNQQSFDQGIQLTECMAEFDVGSELLDAQGIIDLEPALKPIQAQLKGGIYYPDDESGNAHLFCRALESHAQHSGVNFQYNVSVKRLRHDKQRIVAVDTSDGDVKADNLYCVRVFIAQQSPRRRE